MKRIIPVILLLSLSSFLYGNDDRPTTKKALTSLHIIYKNHQLKCRHKDSVMIILDKYDGTGAGIIKNVYYPDNNHRIMIHDVPTGKYILIIRFIGFHSDKFVKVIHVGKKREKSLSFVLADWDEYQCNYK